MTVARLLKGCFYNRAGESTPEHNWMMRKKIVTTLLMAVALIIFCLPASAEAREIRLIVALSGYAMQDDAIVPVLQKYLRPTDYLIGWGGRRLTMSFLSRFPQVRKAMGIATARDLDKLVTQHIPELPYPLDMVYYDPEHWEQTPVEEQQRVPETLSGVAQRIREAGYRVGFAPDRRFTLELYKEINWSEVDLFVFQTQRVVCTEADLPAFHEMVNRVASFIHSRNPRTEIYVQLAFRFAEPALMKRAIDLALRTPIHGFSLLYVLNKDCPTQCTIQNFEQVLAHVTQVKTQSSP